MAGGGNDEGDPTVKGNELEGGIPGPDTVIATAAAPCAGNAVSTAVIAAVSVVEFTNDVGRGEPFQFTTSPGIKSVPFTVSVRPDGLHAGVEFDIVVDAESDVSIGATIENCRLDMPPPGVGVETVTCTGTTDAISAAEIGALS
jgi:hypothetical protein